MGPLEWWKTVNIDTRTSNVFFFKSYYCTNDGYYKKLLILYGESYIFNVKLSLKRSMPLLYPPPPLANFFFPFSHVALLLLQTTTASDIVCRLDPPGLLLLGWGLLHSVTIVEIKFWKKVVSYLKNHHFVSEARLFNVGKMHSSNMFEFSRQKLRFESP